MNLHQKVKIFADANGYRLEPVLALAKETGNQEDRCLSPHEEDNLYLTREDIKTLNHQGRPENNTTYTA